MVQAENIDSRCSSFQLDDRSRRDHHSLTHRSKFPLSGAGTPPPRLVRATAAQRKTEMDQIVLYKGFRIRAYEDWSGLWLAEAKNRLGVGRVLAITRTPMLSTLPRPPVPNARSRY
jgi:hypothetical protein